ncbi:MAG: YdcF family protein [Candidatus Nanopelagicales bacterium]|nr:YdcF family protein [Candidatus Nanopelagicales bacterium]
MSAPAVLLERPPSRADTAPTRRRRAARRFAVLTSAVAIAVGAAPAAAVTDLYRWAGTDDRTATDAIVVLGAAQYQGAPSPVLANRLAHAHELVEDGVSDTIITVGGYQPGDITSEAQAGKEELVADGLLRRQVIAIPFGEDTAESMEAVAAVAASQGLRSITIVTDPAHAARARALATRHQLDAHVSPTQQGPGTALRGPYVLRESAGLLAVWLDRGRSRD